MRGISMRRIDLLPEREKTIHRDLSFSFARFPCRDFYYFSYSNSLSFSSRIKSTRAATITPPLPPAHTHYHVSRCEQSKLNGETEFVLGIGIDGFLNYNAAKKVPTTTTNAVRQWPHSINSANNTIRTKEKKQRDNEKQPKI